MELREASKKLDVAIVKASNKEGFAPLVSEARVCLQKIEADLQQLEMKDEADMTVGEAAAIKASKKMRKEVKAAMKAASKSKSKKVSSGEDGAVNQ